MGGISMRTIRITSTTLRRTTSWYQERYSQYLLRTIQYQVVPTRNYLKHFDAVMDVRCRNPCNLSVEKILHQGLAKKLKLFQTVQFPFYMYTPEPVHENSEYRHYCDGSVLTDQRVMRNRPDHIVNYKTSMETTLIDISILNRKQHSWQV